MPDRHGRAARPALLRVLDEALFRALRGFARGVAALPSRWVLRLADVAGGALYHLDARGRRAGRQNLDVVFPEGLARAERVRILRASFREITRAFLVTIHAAPLTAERFRRWVDVDPAVEDVLTRSVRDLDGAVVVSAHVGNWEILLGLGTLFPEAAPVRFLAEATFHPVMDRFLAWIRGTGGGESAARIGGAPALARHLRRGGIAGLVIDRNVRRNQGGVWIPFFGLEARTTPLPAWLARRQDVPIAPIFCLPRGDGRYVVRLAPEPSRDVRSDDLDADVREITLRLNRLLEDVIREQPEAWTWVIKRWKSRPTAERGRYPRYSFHDP